MDVVTKQVPKGCEDYVKSMAMVAIERFLRRRDIDPLLGTQEQKITDAMEGIRHANGIVQDIGGTNG